MPGIYLAVDVGASRLRVAVFRGESLEARTEVATPRSGGELSVAEAIVRLAERLLEGRRPEAVAIASIGPLDLERGWVVNTPNNPLRSFPLRGPVARALRTRTVLVNDCVAAVWGEYILGGGKGLSDLAYVTISTGIGGGFIVDGFLLVGRRGNAHEVGHIVVELGSDALCGCGGRGHWEALASGSAVPRTAARLTASWRGPRTPALAAARKRGLDAPGLYRAAREGDEFALHVVNYLNRVHAAGLASVAALYDPQAIFLGGSVYLGNRDLIDPGLKLYMPLYSMTEPPPLKPATFGDDEVLYGALAVALDTPPQLARFQEEPR